VIWFGWLFASVGCGPSGQDVVMNLVTDNPVIREDSAKIADNFPSDEVVSALVAALADPSATVRYHAIDSLIELDASVAVTSVIVLLQTEQSPEVRQIAIDALGRFKDPSAVPYLVDLVTQATADPDEEVPLNAIWALGFISDPSAMPLLSSLLDHADPYVVWNASRALKALTL